MFAVAALLAVGLVALRSRVCAVLLPILHAANLLLVLAIAAHPLSYQRLEWLWLSLAALWLLLHVPGIVGTFAYHRLPTTARPAHPRGALVAAGVLAVALLAIVAVALQGFGSRVAAGRAPHEIEFVATSSGPAHVRYASKTFGDGERSAEFSGSWSQAAAIEGAQDRLVLDVTADGQDGRVICEIRFDKEVVAHSEASGPGAVAHCLAEPH